MFMLFVWYNYSYQDHETGLVSTKGDESGALFLREERSLGHISNKLIVEAQHALEVAKVSFDSRNIKVCDVVQNSTCLIYILRIKMKRLHY
jgi:hypothetical protein